MRKQLVTVVAIVSINRHFSSSLTIALRSHSYFAISKKPESLSDNPGIISWRCWINESAVTKEFIDFISQFNNLIIYTLLKYQTNTITYSSTHSLQLSRIYSCVHWKIKKELEIQNRVVNYFEELLTTKNVAVTI